MNDGWKRNLRAISGVVLPLQCQNGSPHMVLVTRPIHWETLPAGELFSLRLNWCQYFDQLFYTQKRFNMMHKLIMVEEHLKALTDDSG